MQILISQEILNKIPGFNVLAYTMEVDNEKTEKFEQYFYETLKIYQTKDDVSSILAMPKIKVARDAYKKLGKDPSHTRLACEALMRRVLKGENLYRLGDIIDIGNLLSIQTNCSVCVVDADKLVGNVKIRIGLENDEYYGIGRGKINVTNIPVYTDEVSPFGNPTSDTDRTKITSSTKNILVMLICFDYGKTKYCDEEQLILDLYQKYANARKITKIEVDKYDG